MLALPCPGMLCIPPVCLWPRSPQQPQGSEASHGFWVPLAPQGRAGSDSR